MKTIKLGKQRQLTIDTDRDVFIRDEVHSEKKAMFTGRRFVRFMLIMDDLNRAVGKARDGKEVSVKEHLGGGWYLSLTPGIACVDLRKFFQHRDSNIIRPSKLGIALTFCEWDALVDAVTKINYEMEGLKAISTCWHATDEELHKWKECTPFAAPTATI